MADKLQGRVKWFSNKKGFGFITPAEGSSVTDDVFVHQSSIFSEGYRTLDEGWEVEFEVGHDEDGKVKAVNVTAPGGGPCTGPRKPRPHIRRRDGRGGGGGGKKSSAAGATAGAGGANNKGPAKPRDPFWHESLNDSVKGMLEEKGIRMGTGTIDVSIGEARVKLGTNGYSSVAHAEMMLGEGSFTCDVDGNVTLTWKHCIAFDKAADQWAASADTSILPSFFCLADANVLPVQPNENAQSLWGDIANPRTALEENGFQMRHVVLTPKRRN